MMLSPLQIEALKTIAAGSIVPELRREEDGWHARWRPVVGDNLWVDSFVRAAAVTPLSADAEMQTHATLHDAWLLALRSRTGLVRWDEAECAAFASELEAWTGRVRGADGRGAIEFAFVADEDRFRLKTAIPRGRSALLALGQSVGVYGPLRELRNDGNGALAVELERNEAENFLRTGAGDLVRAGYRVVGQDLAAEIGLAAEIVADERHSAPAPGAGADAKVDLVVKVAGEPVTTEEIRFLLEQKSTLVFFRNRWIEVDRAVLRECLKALERANGRTKAPNPLTFAMGLGAVGRLEIEEVAAHGWVRGLVNRLRSGRTAADRADAAGGEALALDGFAGALRPYQARGVTWLKFMTDHGFGALLADDMGLGKTIQVIAWILANRPLAEPVLIVAPLTLLSNWAHEFVKFAPALKVYVHQGEDRHLASGFRRAARAADVVVTSYTLLVRDHSLFAGVAWSALVLDEAQAIKNPDTQAARAVRALRPSRRIALSGTPIENTVGDIWSIEEFLNPGFLGDRKSFDERFAKPLAQDPMRAAGRKLRQALEPFVLRRLKSAPEIAAELGEKRIVKEYCELTRGQRADYERALYDYRTGERSQGDVFALLTRLKLVCDGEGKLARLVELLGQIFESGESALVFTQYAKVGAWLQERLKASFGATVPYLHGALSAAAREREIRRFNEKDLPGRPGSNVFVLSLKAGGFGLNLTRATHVIHFDRWWNPAVESQATDRAHRLGQSRTVFVHDFITTGTLEERIDDLLERKLSLEGLLVAGEAFIRLVSLCADGKESSDRV